MTNDPFIHIIQELDTKQRKIRSFRGFFLYTLEIFERTNNSQILKTNLKPSFWRNLKSILRQNKKAVLLQFLFGRGYNYPPSSSYLEDQIQTLENQVDSLQQKIIQLEENQTLQIKKTLSELLKRSEASKISEQDDSQVQDSNSRGKDVDIKTMKSKSDMESKSFLETPSSSFTPLLESLQDNPILKSK
jgi:hypothetical protein